MPEVKTEGKYAYEFLVSELPGTMSREKVTIASGQNLKAGAVLGKVTASGKYVAVAPAASDGSQTAVAVLCTDCDASSGDKTAVAIVRYAEVNDTELDWGSLNAGQITAAKGQLATATIFVRTAV